MIYREILPSQADLFQSIMKDNQWEMVSQDGGQSEFIGWAYIMHWRCTVEGEEKAAEVWLHFSENQGVQASHLEMNPQAKPLIDALLSEW
ncbi:hypothetical protein [Hydrogenovibrio marinus]|uniref:Uncharacterized protein n=1 Tax=Hydrogenovibrio marinus TaxID=28885 RepID=A0A066ZQS0_HYDMR|nr:hypothetical protein [Hydrogenovibrio marinus]KDN96148.1 hypothetical protein EI16_07615 [Hydrogenovibrio marinus]BBN60675.1 hypothetical protein HVMH_2269 [Hydrogenovibrio marinus]